MAKMLKIMVILLLLLSITALVLGVMLFNEREVIKGRTQRLENATVQFANSLHYTDLNRQQLMNYERMEGQLSRLNIHAVDTWQELQDTIQDLENTRLDLAQTREELRVTQNRLEAAEQQIVRLQDDLAERTAELARSRQQVAQLERDKVSLQNRIEDMELQVARMQEENLELTETIADQRALIEEYEADLFEDKATIGTPVGLTAQVAVARPEWNFVVINVGSENGLSLNTEMIVYREDDMIGRIRVSSVQRQFAVAEIMQDWSKVDVREGDHVLF